ncbi:hypothetical protein ScalyP_jg159 [Parmales sp. scaly parma]|nr:hypothetical protein ScalyP_jg159 [Parmales sp. scaly parma]
MGRPWRLAGVPQACTSCPENSSTSSTGSTSAGQCICNVGFFLDGSSCASCGSGTTAAVGSLILEQCICNVGFYPFADTGACTACPGGLTTSDIGSTEFADCTNVLVATSGIATAFASSIDGDKLVMEPGTLTERQLSLENKYVSIYCDTSSAETCTWKGATGKRVVFIYYNGGTTTLGHIIIRDGDSANGGGLYISGTGATSCTNSSKSSEGGASTCENCAAGRFSSAGTSYCTVAGAGKKPNSDQTAELKIAREWLAERIKRKVEHKAEDGGDIETPGIEMRPIGGFDDSGDRLRAQSTGETGLGGDVVSKHEKFAARAAEGELTRKQARVDQLEGSSSNLK